MIGDDEVTLVFAGQYKLDKVEDAVRARPCRGLPFLVKYFFLIIASSLMFTFGMGEEEMGLGIGMLVDEAVEEGEEECGKGKGWYVLRSIARWTILLVAAVTKWLVFLSLKCSELVNKRICSMEDYKPI